MTRDLREVEINAFLAQGELLAQLTAHPGWETWTSLLRAMRAGALEELASCTEPGEFRYWQGVVYALAEILDRPARIVGEAGKFIDAEQADKKAERIELRSVMGVGFDEGDEI